MMMIVVVVVVVVVVLLEEEEGENVKNECVVESFRTRSMIDILLVINDWLNATWPTVMKRLILLNQYLQWTKKKEKNVEKRWKRTIGRNKKRLREESGESFKSKKQKKKKKKERKEGKENEKKKFGLVCFVFFCLIAYHTSWVIWCQSYGVRAAEICGAFNKFSDFFCTGI